MRSLGPGDEVDVLRSPEPDDLTEPPRGRQLGGRAARSSPRSRIASSATSSTTTTIRGQLAVAAESPASTERLTTESRRSSSSRT